MQNRRSTRDVFIGRFRHSPVKASVPQIAKDPTTGEAHLYHRAHWFEDKLYYRGQVLIDNTQEVEA